MSALNWAAGLLQRLAPPERVDDLLGDLEEVHRRRVVRHGRVIAGLLTTLETFGMAVALLRQRPTRPFVPGPRFSGFSWLDIKLGVRMLGKYPGLALVGGFAIAVAIGLGAGVFEVLNDLMRPRLPLDEGERVVGIANLNRDDIGVEMSSMRDFETWRAELRSVEDVGAFTTLHRNLITEDGRAEPVNGVLMSAAGFRVARVPPLLGRTLIDADESPTAPAVVVIGFHWWQHLFGADPAVIGRTVKVSDTQAVIVGVMPPGFRFPVEAELWMPLRFDPMSIERGDTPRVSVFARLTPGVNRGRAQAELTAIGERTTAQFPATHARLRPRVLTYAGMIMGEDLSAGDPNVDLINVLFLVLVVVVCTNVATLVFARTLSRAGEIAVRNALGASRGRIVLQLFAEALVLGTAAAAVGLAAAGLGVEWAIRKAMAMEMANSARSTLEAGPFWLDPSLDLRTVAYVALLTVLGSAIVGVLPALKLTGRSIQMHLRAEATRSLRFGRMWTGVIIAQVALTVALLPLALSLGWQAARFQDADVGVAVGPYLVAFLYRESETETGASPAPFDPQRIQNEMAARLREDPLVASVTFASAVPGSQHTRRRIEIEGVAATFQSRDENEVRVADVAADYFEALRAPLSSGRAFAPGDAGNGAVIVNESFLSDVLRGQNALGRRVRYLDDSGAPAGAWHEIVGVAPDLGMAPEDPSHPAGIYHPLVPRNRGDFVLLRVQGDPAAYIPRLRAVAGAVDPMIRPNTVTPLADVGVPRRMGNWLRATVIGLVAGITMLLSVAGIFALTSFTVTQRTREIGIRSALGGEPHRIVRQIFARVALQIGAGVALGTALTVTPGYPSGRVVALLSVVGFVAVASLLACGIPVARALRIEPTEALRADT